jgi:hypothetical protein
MSNVVELLMQTAEANEEVLAQNDKMGDVFAIPREVDFHLRAPDAERAQLVAGFINDFQFGEATVENADGNHAVSVTIVMPITQHVLNSVSGFITCLSTLYDLEFDGWGGPIQTDDSP